MAVIERPDIIIMDLEMPILDGWEATRWLKSKPQTRDIPVIALSAHALDGEREKAFAAGCDEFDAKPIQFERLLAEVLPRQSNSDLGDLVSPARKEKPRSEATRMRGLFEHPRVPPKGSASL
jgi:CheY-like chemotaxis protein